VLPSKAAVKGMLSDSGETVLAPKANGRVAEGWAMAEACNRNRCNARSRRRLRSRSTSSSALILGRLGAFGEVSDEALETSDMENRFLTGSMVELELMR
jgi:hypothetical protein